MFVSGFDNEKSIVNAIDGLMYKQLNSNLKQFIKELFPEITDNDILKSNALGGIYKRDLEIILNNKSVGVSVKKGVGNSVHQERVEDFINFLNNIDNVPYKVATALRKFIWGDGTLDGTGNIECRTKNVARDYAPEIKILQDYFTCHSEKIIYRVLVSGAYNDNVDYIYYGEPNDGVWCKAIDAVKYLSTCFNSRATICIGNLSFQAWNRATYGGRSEGKRGQVQLKWGSIYKDILKIRKEQQ